MSKTNENATMAKPNPKDFQLEKVKLVNKGGICAHYDVTEVVGGTSYTNQYVVDNGMDIHPDLAGLFEDLRPIVARVFNINSFLSFVEDPANKIPAKIQEQARGFAGELLNNIEVRGVSFSGKDDNVGVVITAVYTTANGLKTCINTPRIKMATISFGFEEELEEIVGKIEREVYAYLFDGKQAQLSLFGADGNANPEANANDQEPDDLPKDM